MALSGGLLILAAIFRDRSRGALERLAVRMAGRWPALHLGDAEETRATISGVLAKDGRSAAGFVLHFVAWTLGAIEAWIAFHLMGADISLAEAAVIDSLFTGLRTFAFFIPGAIGVQEAAYVAFVRDVRHRAGFRAGLLARPARARFPDRHTVPFRLATDRRAAVHCLPAIPWRSRMATSIAQIAASRDSGVMIRASA